MGTKKAGIIVGVILIAVAVIVVLIFGGKSSEDEATDVTETKPVVTETQTPTQQEPTQEETSNNSNLGTQGAIVIDEDSLVSMNMKEFSEVAFVSRKHIYLQGNQLYYTIDVMLGDNEVVTYYTSEAGYYLLGVNDKVKIDYVVYTNDNGISFTQINSVVTVK